MGNFQPGVSVIKQLKVIIEEKGGYASLRPWLSKIVFENISSSIVEISFSNNELCSLFDATLQSLLQAALTEVDNKFSNVHLSVELRGAFSSIKPNRHMTFDNFSVGPANRLAKAAASSVAEVVNHQYNPLFIHAGIGEGKTHLLHAIVAQAQETHPEWNIRFLSTELFCNHLFSAVQTNRLDQFRNWMLNADLFLLDDIHRLASQPNAQEEFFYLFDRLHNNQKQIVLTAQTMPKYLSGLPEHMTSRFGWGLVVGIDSIQNDTRRAIVTQKADQMNLALSHEVIDYLSTQVTGNIRELEGLLNTLCSHAVLLKTEIDMDLVRSLTADQSTQSIGMISLNHIQEAIANFFNLEINQLISKSRARSVAYPRQIGMFLAKEMTTSSLEEIGQSFGGRDHSTVKHGCEKIQRLLKTDTNLRKQIDQIKENLRMVHA